MPPCFHDAADMLLLPMMLLLLPPCCYALIYMMLYFAAFFSLACRFDKLPLRHCRQHRCCF